MAISSNATTLTFNDATTQTTAPVNTNANVNSVGAGTGISVSATTGALTVTNAGVTSITAGTGISVSASTGGVTISAAGGGVTSLNGQTGSITNTGHNNIGSYTVAFVRSSSSYTAGATVAGTDLHQQTNSSPSWFTPFGNVSNGVSASSGVTGTWRVMATSRNQDFGEGTVLWTPNIWVRIS